MVTLIKEETINGVISSYQTTEKTIIEGSDEHLDLILDVQNALKNVTESTRKLVNEIEANFNSISEEAAKDAVVKIFPCFRLAYQIMATIKRSKIHRSVESYVCDFNREVDELKEFVSDLSRYKVQKNNEIENLLALFND